MYSLFGGHKFEFVSLAYLSLNSLKQKLKTIGQQNVEFIPRKSLAAMHQHNTKVSGQISAIWKQKRVQLIRLWKIFCTRSVSCGFYYKHLHTPKTINLSTDAAILFGVYYIILRTTILLKKCIKTKWRFYYTNTCGSPAHFFLKKKDTI